MRPSFAAAPATSSASARADRLARRRSRRPLPTHIVGLVERSAPQTDSAARLLQQLNVVAISAETGAQARIHAFNGASPTIPLNERFVLRGSRAAAEQLRPSVLNELSCLEGPIELTSTPEALTLIDRSGRNFPTDGSAASLLAFHRRLETLLLQQLEHAGA